MIILNIVKETPGVDLRKNPKKIKKKEVEAIRKKKEKTPEKVEDIAPR